MAGEKERVEGYLDMVERLEPNIHPIDASAFYASAAISLKRIADMLEKKWQYELRQQDEWLRKHGMADLADKRADK